MKLGMLMALSGAAAGALSDSASAAPTIGTIFDTTSPFLMANNLWSAGIIIVGWAPTDRYQGFIGTQANTWNVRTAGTFFNIDSVPQPFSASSFLFEDGFYAAPSNDAVLNNITGGAAAFDSGLLGGSGNNPAPINLGNPADNYPGHDVGDFGKFSAGGSPDVGIWPMAWLSLNSNGLVPPASLNVLRITWTANTTASVSFVLTMNNPIGDIPMSIFFPPAPGTLALVAIAGIAGSRRRRQ